MMRTALTIFIAWMVNTLVVEASDTFDFWLFFIFSDAVAAWFVLYQPAGKVQSVIGGLLLSQIAVHGVYGISKFISPETLNPFRYMDVIDTLGLLQLLLLGGWAGGHWSRVAYRALRHRSHWRPRSQSPRSMA